MEISLLDTKKIIGPQANHYTKTKSSGNCLMVSIQILYTQLLTFQKFSFQESTRWSNYIEMALWCFHMLSKFSITLHGNQPWNLPIGLFCTWSSDASEHFSNQEAKPLQISEAPGAMQSNLEGKIPRRMRGVCWLAMNLSKQNLGVLGDKQWSPVEISSWCLSITSNMSFDDFHGFQTIECSLLAEKNAKHTNCQKL